MRTQSCSLHFSSHSHWLKLSLARTSHPSPRHSWLSLFDSFYSTLCFSAFFPVHLPLLPPQRRAAAGLNKKIMENLCDSAINECEGTHDVLYLSHKFFFFFAATLLRTTVRKQCKRTTRKGSSTKSAHSCHHSQLVTVIPHDLMDRRDGPLCSCGDASNKDKAYEHAAVHPSMELTCASTPRELVKLLKKWAVSSENRPPTSPPRTTSRALPSAPASSEYRLSWARTNDAPFSVAHLGFATPSRVNGHTRVVSMVSCAPRNRGKPSTTTWSLRSSTLLNTGKSRSRMKTFVLTLPPASRQIRAATFSSGNWTRRLMVAKAIK